jgi:hypothetical protein
MQDSRWTNEQEEHGHNPRQVPGPRFSLPVGRRRYNREEGPKACAEDSKDPDEIVDVIGNTWARRG